MSELSLTSWQRRRLRRQLQQTQDARVYRRTLALLQVDRGLPLSQVAQELLVSRQSLYNWIREYARDHDPAALADRGRPGRPTCWGEDARQELHWLIRQPPARLGYFATAWTVPLLLEELERSRGLRRCGRTLRRELDRLGYVWKRGRYALGPDPELGKKRQLRRRIRGLPLRSVLLAQDETDLLLLPPLRAGWAKRGQPFDVPISGRNARRVIFGAMNLRTGSRLFLPRQRQRAGDFQAFLRLVHDRYRGWQVALLLDEDSSHTAAGSTGLAEEFNMELIRLPKRSPKLNPMDTLWGQGKDVISANKQYSTIDEQVERFIAYLSGLSRTEALHTSGVLSEDFWLRKALSKNFCPPA